mmetsp:Transcript_13250/g.18655  ORF Transcript_13250/g.18655 Transcript_13250/m.18655 type:complete len:338 (+) Transcript_13250:79-1092(+)|eukprot:CAMPEP_0171484102 /NCGR_PEP_ID=MMETSP0946-20130122/8606_1 /TAXON_ID=109269 /ORGANISM="Vaucheria litorea, Strain CCMP2940" /LENGTH=337 /DNA_ID=CAMNT_0012016731 /DNA_START=78 /DNA_END=1091 /DNA_ORIENTATION=-
MNLNKFFKAILVKSLVEAFFVPIPKTYSKLYSVKVIYDPNNVLHKAKYQHSENSNRVDYAAQELKNVEGIQISSPADDKERALRAIYRVHEKWYVDDVLAMCLKGGGNIDFDTYLTKDSFQVLISTTSAWLDCCQATLNDENEATFALTRPPGHHATSCQAMGFCIINFAAATAMYALEELGAQRISMLDFDVHYGNGVAAIVRKDSRIRYCSLHEKGSFPGTGLEESEGGPNKNIRTIEVEVGCSWKDNYSQRFEKEVIPWLLEHDPDILIVSAGYDALEDDELANLCMQPEDFYLISSKLKESFGNRIMFGLEGGYAVEATSKAIKYTLQPFLEG